MAERTGLFSWFPLRRRSSSEADPLVVEALRKQEQSRQEVVDVKARLFANEFDNQLRLTLLTKDWRDGMPKLAEYLAPDFDSFDLQSIFVFKQEILSVNKIIINLAFEDPNRPLNIPIANATFEFDPDAKISSSMTTEFGLEYRVTRGSDKKDPYADAHRLSMIAEVMNYIIGKRNLITDGKAPSVH